MTESTILSENKCDQYRMSVPINVMYHFVGVRGGHKSAQNTDTPKHHKSASNFQTTSHWQNMQMYDDIREVRTNTERNFHCFQLFQITKRNTSPAETKL